MRRRTFLVAGGLTLAGLAGCMSQGDDPETSSDGPATDKPTTAESTTTEPTTDEQTPTDEPTTEPPEGGGVDVQLEAVQPGVVELVSPDSVGVRDPDSQFVYVRVETDAYSPALDSWELQTGGENYPLADLDEYRLYREYFESDSYTVDRGSGWLLFELPEQVGAADVRVAWAGGHFELPESAREQLATSTPPLSVDFTGPDTAAVGESVTLTVEVTNEGETPGQFVAGLNRIGPQVAYIPVTVFSERVPAGESVSVPFETEALRSPGGDDLGDDEPDVTYRLVTAEGSHDVSIPMSED